MIASGIVRKIDELGRIVIPKEIRRVLGWVDGDPIEIFTDGETVVLKGYRPGCIFCSNMTDLTEFKGKRVCKPCIRGLK